MKQVFEKRAAFSLLALLAVLLAAMALVPLDEAAEGRTAELARRMLEPTGGGASWWGRPPFQAWLSAASMWLFGTGAFAARLPSLLFSLGTLALVGHAAFRRAGKEAALTAMLVLAACPGFFAASGMVMADAALVFSVTLALVSFWRALQGSGPANKNVWGWLFFAGCGLGLLAKGPVALAAAGLPVFFWALFRLQWKDLRAQLPWLGGLALMLAIALPGHFLAEGRAGGFLRFFIMGESASRFVGPPWPGDRYDFAAAHMYGTVWLYVLAGTLPWCLAALQWGRAHVDNKDGWRLFLVLWAVASPVFFTFFSAIAWPSALLMMPGFALLFAEMSLQKPWRKHIPFAAGALALAGALAIAACMAAPQKFSASQKDIVAAWRALEPAPDGRLIFFGARQEFSSAGFYARSRAAVLRRPEGLQQLAGNNVRDCLVIYEHSERRLPPALLRMYKEEARLTNRLGTRILLCEL
jgi:4-amino-4-deoxy-L-arabinose transferase-like glycosyltransferase